MYASINQKGSNLPQCELNKEMTRDKDKSILRWGVDNCFHNEASTIHFTLYHPYHIPAPYTQTDKCYKYVRKPRESHFPR